MVRQGYTLLSRLPINYLSDKIRVSALIYFCHEDFRRNDSHILKTSPTRITGYEKGINIELLLRK